METKGLTLSYGGSIIIDGLGLTIPKGKITVLIAGNGCGKSPTAESLDCDDIGTGYGYYLIG